jgi:hypothetical protein
MAYTSNYNLKKPAETDYFDINDFNGNSDIIDTNLKTVSDAANNTISKTDFVRAHGAGNTSGSSSSFTVSIQNFSYTNLASANILFNRDVPAGSTLNVNSLGNVPLYTSDGQPIQANMIASGSIAGVIYNSSKNRFYLTSVSGKQALPTGNMVYKGEVSSSSALPTIGNVTGDFYFVGNNTISVYNGSNFTSLTIPDPIPIPDGNMIYKGIVQSLPSFEKKGDFYLIGTSANISEFGIYNGSSYITADLSIDLPAGNMVYKGRVTSLPTTGNTKGDFYFLHDSDGRSICVYQDTNFFKFIITDLPDGNMVYKDIVSNASQLPTSGIKDGDFYLIGTTSNLAGVAISKGREFTIANISVSLPAGNMIYKGTVASKSALPTTGNKSGDTYFVGDDAISIYKTNSFGNLSVNPSAYAITPVGKNEGNNKLLTEREFIREYGQVSYNVSPQYTAEGSGSATGMEPYMIITSVSNSAFNTIDGYIREISATYAISTSAGYYSLSFATMTMAQGLQTPAQLTDHIEIPNVSIGTSYVTKSFSLIDANHPNGLRIKAGDNVFMGIVMESDINKYLKTKFGAIDGNESQIIIQQISDFDSFYTANMLTYSMSTDGNNEHVNIAFSYDIVATNGDYTSVLENPTKQFTENNVLVFDSIGNVKDSAEL